MTGLTPLYFIKKATLILSLIVTAPGVFYAMEICDNGIDDDNDGLIDLNDPECDCQDIFDNRIYILNGDFESSIMCCRSNDFSGGDCLEHWIPVNGSPEHIDPTCYSTQTELSEITGIPVNNSMIGLIYNDFSAFKFKETFGSCTNTTLEIDTLYRLEFDIRLSPKEELNAGEGNPKLFFYGLKTCDELMFTAGTEGDLCDLNFDIHPIDSVEFDQISQTEWKTVVRNIRPKEITNALIIGYDCNQGAAYQTKRFIFIDNIKLSKLLNQQFDYNIEIDTVGSLCNNDFYLTATTIPDFDYQWYRDGVAIQGAKTNTLAIERDMRKAGTHQLRLLNEGGCYLSDRVEVLVADESIDTTICTGLTLDILTGSFDVEGIYSEDVLSTYGCINKTYNLNFREVIVGETIDETFPKGSSFSFGGNQFNQEGIYEVTLKTAEGCDSIVELILSEIDFTIWVPNVFTPGADTNDRLTVYTKDRSATVVVAFTIFDRWGNQVFNKQNFLPNIPSSGWDGQFQATSLGEGTYAYLVEVEFITGEIIVDTGEILLSK